MDLLFKKYASPIEFMAVYIDSGRFGEFVEEILKLNRSQEDEKYLWELWLHKVYDDTTFDEFRKDVKAGLKSSQSKDNELDDDGIMAIKERVFGKGGSGIL